MKSINDILFDEMLQDSEIKRLAVKLGKTIDKKAEQIFSSVKERINPRDFYELVDYMEDTIESSHSWTEGIQRFFHAHYDEVSKVPNVLERLESIKDDERVKKACEVINSVILEKGESIYQGVKETMHYEDFSTLLTQMIYYIMAIHIHEKVDDGFYRKHLKEDPEAKVDEDGDRIC